MEHSLLLGCIADDFTGASDAASFIAKSGMKTILFNGVPGDDTAPECDAAVIALKTRSAPRDQAVAESLAALDLLLARGAKHIYSKYCSTFDSTREGNIGPILDAILEKTGAQASIICPALPVNGRVVRDGLLYVNGVPLHQSPMKDHPLNPMWESDLAKLMEPQSKYPCVKVGTDVLARGADAVRAEVEARRAKLGADVDRYYIIPDYVDDDGSRRIAEAFGSMKVMSGGSGILTDLGRIYLGDASGKEAFSSGTNGRAVVLAGSCSVATLAQIDEFKAAGAYSYKIDPMKLLDGTLDAAAIWKEVEAQRGGREVLIYSSDSPENVRDVQRAGLERTSRAIERVMADLALLASRAGCTRTIVAGGETSGAVTQALGYDSYLIGEPVAPGVPIMAPTKDTGVRLVLKSGNFGGQGFFERALAMTAR